MSESREDFINRIYNTYSDQRFNRNLTDADWVVIFIDISTLQDLINYERFQYHPLDDIQRELNSLIRRINENESFLFKKKDIPILETFITDIYNKRHPLLEEIIPFTLDEFYTGRQERIPEPEEPESVVESQFIKKVTELDEKSPYEEDSPEWNDIISSEDSISDISVSDISVCSNESPIMLMPYEQSDYENIVIIYVQNKLNKFETATCITRDELKSFIKSDIDTEIPNNIMTLYTKPKRSSDYLSGLGGKPTGRVVVRLPHNQIYVTSGSIKRIFNNINIKEWYALPLFGGKKRRIGNLRGIFGASMNHGQVPGFVIYKLYTKEEIQSKIEVKEEIDDYPMTFAVEQFKTIFDIFNEKEEMFKGVFQNFVNTIIENIIN